MASPGGPGEPKAGVGMKKQADCVLEFGDGHKQVVWPGSNVTFLTLLSGGVLPGWDPSERSIGADPKGAQRRPLHRGFEPCPRRCTRADLWGPGYAGRGLEHSEVQVHGQPSLPVGPEGRTAGLRLRARFGPRTHPTLAFTL